MSFDCEWEGPLVVYGEIAFDPRCPKCMRFWKRPDTVKIHMTNAGESFHHAEGVVCSRCGPIEPSFVCWTSDFV